MGIFNRGRAKEYKKDEIDNIHPVAGGYIIFDKERKYKYTGIAGDLQERAKEHRASGKFEDGDRIAPLMVKKGASYDDLRDWERRKIAKHKPYANKTKGGEGRPIDQLYYEEDYEEEAKSRFDVLALLWSILDKF